MVGFAVVGSGVVGFAVVGSGVVGSGVFELAFTGPIKRLYTSFSCCKNYSYLLPDLLPY